MAIEQSGSSNDSLPLRWDPATAARVNENVVPFGVMGCEGCPGALESRNWIVVV